MNYKCLILMLFVLFLSIGIVSANEIGDNITSVSDESPIEIADDINHVSDDINLEESDVFQGSSNDLIQSDDEIIVVNDWDELQYYCAQTDKDYTLKLKENTNFYPSSANSISQQIKVKNNVRIIGSEGSYFGDSSSEPIQLKFLAIVVEDNAKVGITLENITFKWIKAGGSSNLPDGIFLKMGGKKNSIITNCNFMDICTYYGHSCLIHLSKGTATIDNCSFINCTNNYGVLSVYGSYPHMIVKIVILKIIMALPSRVVLIIVVS